MKLHKYYCVNTWMSNLDDKAGSKGRKHIIMLSGFKETSCIYKDSHEISFVGVWQSS